MPFGLSPQIFDKIQNVLAQYPEIEQAIIYGSRARGDQRTGSDIDLTLKGKNLTEALRKQIFVQLDALNTPYLFDLSLFDQLNNPALIENIQREGKVFSEKTF